MSVSTLLLFFFSSRRRHTRSYGDWSSDVCSSDLPPHVLHGVDDALHSPQSIADAPAVAAADEAAGVVDRARSDREEQADRLAGADPDHLRDVGAGEAHDPPALVAPTHANRVFLGELEDGAQDGRVVDA